jgi:hypothetical protein
MKKIPPLTIHTTQARNKPSLSNGIILVLAFMFILPSANSQSNTFELKDSPVYYRFESESPQGIPPASLNENGPVYRPTVKVSNGSGEGKSDSHVDMNFIYPH